MTNRKVIERISPLWLGVGISGLLILILLAIETLLGRWGLLLVEGEFDPFAKVSEGNLRDFRIAIVHCLQVGYLPAAFLYVMRSSRQTVLLLQDVLDCTHEECETLAASVRVGVAWFVIFGVIGFLMSIGGPYMVPPAPEAPWNPSTWSPEVAWHRILGPVATVWGWWLGYTVISVSLRMSRIAKKLQQVDLFDFSPLAPFTQLGLRNGLLLIGSLSIWSLMMFETGFGQLLIFLGSIALMSTVVALVLPVRGVHERIKQSKQVELRWLNKEISQQRSKFQTSETVRVGGEMADLIAYRGLIESVSDWPFTTSTYTRLFLYALLPVMSWGVGMVAEEIVGRVIF